MKALLSSTFVLCFVLSARAEAVKCIAVEGPAVRASVLAPFIEQVQPLDSDRLLTSTPDPGTRRWITEAEIRQWGFSPSKRLAAPGICLERQLHPLRSEDVTREIRLQLQKDRGAAQLVGITSVRPLLVPEGHLRLPPSGFRLLSSRDGFCSFLWRGSVEFDSSRLTAITVLGRYQAEAVHFVAKRSLQPGDVLTASDYERITKPGCMGGERAELTSLEGSIEGSVARRTIAQGAVIEAAMLKAPQVVEEGGAVRVMASAGGAVVGIDAVAEKPGRQGESVFVRNRESGKRIRVLLTGKGEARAIVAGGAR
jgi:flagella basal body P-ring formation protein FlgA